MVSEEIKDPVEEVDYEILERYRKYIERYELKNIRVLYYTHGSANEHTVEQWLESYQKYLRHIGGSGIETTVGNVLITIDKSIYELKELLTKFLLNSNEMLAKKDARIKNLRTQLKEMEAENLRLFQQVRDARNLALESISDTKKTKKDDNNETNNVEMNDIPEKPKEETMF